jgi:hypothetical protein
MRPIQADTYLVDNHLPSHAGMSLSKLLDLPLNLSLVYVSTTTW